MPLNPSLRILPNGITLVAQENHATAAVSLVASMRAGGHDDPAGYEGTAALTARVLDRGTTHRTADVIADELDSRGASLAASAGRHQVSIAATCLADDLTALLAVVADVLQAPTFPEPDVASRRGELLTAIRQEEDDPASVAVDRLMRELYAAHPYGRRVRGTVASVEALTREHLTAFHRDHFAPAALSVVMVGSLPADLMLDMASRAFDGWSVAVTHPQVGVPDASIPTSRRYVQVAMPDKAQADVAYGFIGIRRADAAYMATAVMNNVLGQYALGGRLGENIRERQGMAYYVFSSIDAGLGPGPLMVRAGVAAQNVEPTIASIDAELTAVVGDGFTEKEVAESRQYMIGALPRQLETNAGVAAFLLNTLVHDLGLDYDRRYPDLVRQVTREMATEAARRLLNPARATVVVAGPEVPRP